MRHDWSSHNFVGLHSVPRRLTQRAGGTRRQRPLCCLHPRYPFGFTFIPPSINSSHRRKAVVGGHVCHNARGEGLVSQYSVETPCCMPGPPTTCAFMPAWVELKLTHDEAHLFASGASPFSGASIHDGSISFITRARAQDATIARVYPLCQVCSIGLPLPRLDRPQTVCCSAHTLHTQKRMARMVMI